MYTTRKSATSLKSLTSCLNSSSLYINGGQEQLPKFSTSGLVPADDNSQTQRGANWPDAEEPRNDAPFMKWPIDVLFFSMVTTGESGASSPTKAS